MCINLLVRHYYLSCLCLYSLSLCKNKYVSWSTTPIYSVFKSISKRRFLHRKIWAPPTAEITRSSKRRFLHSRKGKFLSHSFPCPYAYYPNSSAGVFRCLRKERFLHRKNQLSHSPPMFARQCSPAIAKARFPPCTICSRNRQYTEKTLKTEILPRQKRGFYMLSLADLAVAISFYSLLNLLHPVWKSLSPNVFSSPLACGNLSFYIL